MAGAAPPSPGWRRELRPTLGTAGAAVVAAVAWSAWRGTGSRLSLFVCFAALAAPLLDVVLALVATRRLRLTATGGTTDAQVGDTVEVQVSVTGPRLPVRARVTSFPDTSAVVVEPPAAGSLTAVARHRGLLVEVEVETVSGGLASLAGCARRRPVALPRLLAVGPRPTAPAGPFPELFGAWGEGAPRPATVGDVVRGVRPYVPGDPRRRVHWPATARTGDLVVKEVEEPGAPRLVLALDLGGGGDVGERAAGRAAWYCYEGLRRGYDVVVATAEDGRPVTGPCRSAAEVNRRLAAASRGAPDLPAGGPIRQAVLLVTDTGDSWD